MHWINDSAGPTINSGELLRMMREHAPNTIGVPYQVDCLQGLPADPTAACAWSDKTAQCALTVHPMSYKLSESGESALRAACTAKRTGDAIAITCPTAVPMAAFGKPDVNVLACKVTFAGVWSATSGTYTLRVCGAYRKQALLALIKAVPDEKADRVPISTTFGLVEALLKTDLDLDGDGEKESASFAGDLELAPSLLVPAPQ